MQRAVIRIHGIVQGVGFRPFIHKLVRKYSLCGYISNTSSGVILELEGEREELERFVRDVPVYAPKLAVIEQVEAEYTDTLVNFTAFEIRKSITEQSRNTLISPDICICDDCLRELRDPKDRRFGYPFINCTNCGPRFTIIKDVPYDRPYTSMGSFPMCPDCDREYHDIEDRRYHAQPDCCPECGPEVFFAENASSEKICSDAAIQMARELILSGGIVCIKGLGGMHLACRADLPEVVNTLRKRKQRDEKPFALMCRDADCARKICEVSPDEEHILTGFRRPIVLLNKLDRHSLSYVSENGCVGVMLPYTPLHYLLFGDDIDMLVMTSANLSDTPIMYKNEEAFENLKDIADGFLLHNRDIQTRCDDSLCSVVYGKEYFLRRSRGYVPYPVSIPEIPGLSMRPVLACGAEQKASFCLSRGSYVFPSQHIGDLKNIETLDNYSKQIEHFRRLFDIVPEAVVCDLHPDYMSTGYAEEQSEELKVPLVRVQHHHAHMAACMADNGLYDRVIGLVWDGTGLGTDGTVWGGECLTGDFSGFERFGSIRPIPLPGGDLCTKDTDRVAFSLLKDSGCSTEHIPGAAQLDFMLNNSINSPLSSGMGRLFDGAAAILEIKRKCSYEGQGAVLLEAAAEDGITEEFSPEFYEDRGVTVFDWRNMIRGIQKRYAAGECAGRLAAVFMNTLVSMAVETCVRARFSTGINDVCLSGGCFQNMYVLKRLIPRLEAEGFNVYHHVRVSPNDEGLSLGQLMIGEYIINNRR